MASNINLEGLTPKAAGLPEKFKDYRPGQMKALDRISKSSAKYILLQAPTGIGKTAIMATVQRLSNRKMLYLCNTIQLEEQVRGDFPYSEMLKGRSNYPTVRNPATWPRIHAGLCNLKGANHCSFCCKGLDFGDQCDASKDCPYTQAKRRTLSAQLGILNFSLFLNEANFIGGFSGYPWITIDEADTIESSLMGFVEVSFSPKWIKKLSLPPPERKTVESAWITWAKEIVQPTLETKIQLLQNRWGIEEVQEEKELSRALAKVKFFLSDIETNPWIYEDSEETFTFKPVFVKRYGQQYVWRHGERFLLMSATILSPDQFCRDLGIPRKEAEFIDIKSEFEAKRRPVYYVPSAPMTNKTKTWAWPKAVKSLDESLLMYKNFKVLVHTVSGELAQYVYNNSAYRDRMITYGKGFRREDALRLYIQSPTPKILVAQSMDRGVDLPDDLCRVIIILKVPYLNLGDKQVSRRVYASKDGNSWYQVQTWRTLIQMCGRGMRHADDSCIVEIHDEEFGRLYDSSGNLAPAWWKEALHLPT